MGLLSLLSLRPVPDLKRRVVVVGVAAGEGSRLGHLFSQLLEAAVV